MPHKGERFKQVPTLWHIGWGYPCRVIRKRKGQSRWQNEYHDVLTMATARRWKRLEAQGKALVRRDLNMEAAVSSGISHVPPRALWAAAESTGGKP
jgi:hypothetical protein